MIHRYCKLLGVAAIVFGVSTRVVFAEPITLWPSVPFARGQDICQFVDTYGSSKRQQTGEMISQLERLFANDAESKEALHRTYRRSLPRPNTLRHRYRLTSPSRRVRGAAA